MIKKCRDCGEVKPVNQFSPALQCRMGVRPECRSCMGINQRNYARRPGIREKIKAHRAQPHVRKRQNDARKSPEGKASYQRRASSNPSFILSFNLYRALKRRPSTNPVTHAELMQIYKDQRGLCALSGLKMTWMKGKITLTSLSIDRIDSSKGYERDNVRLVCHGVNRLKGDATDVDMLAMAMAIVANMERQSPEPTWRSDCQNESDFMVLH